MKLAVYLSAVPAKSKNQFKRNLLAKFALGARVAGESVLIIDDVNRVIPADIAVLQGWIGIKTSPHLEQRRRVIEQQRSSGCHTLVIDSNLFGFLDTEDRDKYLRYSLDGIFPTTGYYFDSNIDESRWAEICAAYRFQERDWKRDGTHVLICLQRDGGWSMGGLPVIDWLDSMRQSIRTVTDRPIIVRAHPGSRKIIPEIQKRWSDLIVSDLSDIRQDFDRAWCTITYNSSPAVASILWGVPAFITDPEPRRSQAWSYADVDLARVEQPTLFDRQQFYHRLSQCHFATDRLESGNAWRFMRARLP